MAVGIPRYRLPQDTLQREIDDIVASPKVNLFLNTPVKLTGKGDSGPSMENLRRDYDAVFVGVGTHGSMQMRIPGEELKGVLHGAHYLRQLNLAQLRSNEADIPRIGKHVVVESFGAIGDGGFDGVRPRGHGGHAGVGEQSVGQGGPAQVDPFMQGSRPVRDAPALNTEQIGGRQGRRDGAGGGEPSSEPSGHAA